MSINRKHYSQDDIDYFMQEKMTRNNRIQTLVPLQCRFHLKHGYPLFCSSHKNSFRPPYYVKRFLFIFFR